MSALLRLDGVRVMRGQRKVLDSLSLTVEQGERVALTGPNGAGKTTLLRTLVGLEKPQTGTVYAFGAVRKTEREFREVRAKAGYLFQDPDDQLFCPTVIDDVAFGPLNLGCTPAEAAERARDTLNRLQLDHLTERITHHLSGGEKRLVSLAAVLAMEPEVLLLDEPTNALDELHCGLLMEILESLNTTMVIVSHERSFITQLATRAVFLNNGTLEAATIHEHRHTHEHRHIHPSGSE